MSNTSSTHAAHAGYGSLPSPTKPIKLALIGAGQRSRTIYRPLFQSLAPWVEVVAVCDPVKANADSLAQSLNVKAYYDIHELVRDQIAEAALIITPVESHHSISVYLSAHGIHNMAETSWCSTLVQARDMIETAKKHDVVIRVAENFYGFPIDRMAQTVKRSGYLGRIGRIYSYNDHTGYHNNSRWIVFAGQHPVWAQSIRHGMETIPFQSSPERYHDHEDFHANYFAFPDGLLVIDSASNAKGFLGRQPRPGYTEWQGERGTLVHRGDLSTIAETTHFADGQTIRKNGAHWSSVSELRYLSDDAIGRKEPFRPTGYADQVSPVVNEFIDWIWTRSYAETAQGLIEYVNPYRPIERSDHFLDEYGCSIMGHIVNFALAVRGIGESEFNEQDALMSLMMDIGTKESALQEGRRIALPLQDELESDRSTLAKLKQKFQVDPLDVEAMLNISYPKP
ncbi:putative oxidoreductase YcjS [compost metagenome]